MTTQKLTKEQRKEIALKEYKKIINPAYEEYEKIKDTAYKEYLKIDRPAWKEYLRKCEEINNEPEEVEEIIEHKGRKYKLVEELAK